MKTQEEILDGIHDGKMDAINLCDTIKEELISLDLVSALQSINLLSLAVCSIMTAIEIAD